MERFSFFSIKTQFENLGDALINRELIKLASLHSMTCVDLSRCEESFARSISDGSSGTEFIKGFTNLFWRMLVRRLKGSDCYYYLSPGGYFGSIPPREIASRLLNTAVIATMWLIGVKVILAGISAERLSRGSLFMFKIRRLFIYRLMVRDGLSNEYLSRRSVRVDGVMPDLAFNLYEPVTPSALMQRTAAIAVISFRSDQHPGAQEKVRTFLKRLAHTLPSNTRVLFYSQVVRDDAFMSQLSKDPMWSGTGGATFVAEHRSVERAQKILGQATVVFSNRLHVLLVGGSVGVKIVPVVDGEVNDKVKGLFADLSVSTMGLDAEFSTFPSGTSILKEGRAKKRHLERSFKDVYSGKRAV